MARSIRVALGELCKKDIGSKHHNGPWHIICIQERAGFETGSSREVTSTLIWSQLLSS